MEEPQVRPLGDHIIHVPGGVRDRQQFPTPNRPEIGLLRGQDQLVDRRTQ